MKALKILFVVILAALMAFSCSDKKSNPTENQEQPPEQLSAEPVTLPQSMQQSHDPQVMMVRNYIQMINLFQQFANSLMPRNGVHKPMGNTDVFDGPPWVYTWHSDSLAFKLTITIEDNNYHWRLTITGTSYGHTFNGSVYMEAWQALDGKSGKLVIYDYDYEEGNHTLQWTWNIDEKGTETIVYTDSASNTKLEVVQNSDLSGSLKVWQNNTLIFQANWTGSGSGTWVAYDENGNQTGSGSWG